MENETLATEMLRELKSNGRRWFIAFLVVLFLWFATIGAFLWYISLPVEETTVEQEDNRTYMDDFSDMLSDLQEYKNKNDGGGKK